MVITVEDMDRFKEMQDETPKQLVVIDTIQFFEIEIPADMNPNEFVDTDECRKLCADKILSQTTDLRFENVLLTFNEQLEMWE